ncbi:hypothetical protein H2201_006817 [Coniosporium apollinis]|uniref:RWD domain-containing protein n=2 Tax=Coniosporium TaxID=2810619 RepID=A0ABQ9NKU9_9PEZI|nr:hypothetical protein H2199_007161 [Cladosporium sp. JES 115]KAJ9660738.1 hypothetical protein H2201_006817 [Coniosporium apollinis]
MDSSALEDELALLEAMYPEEVTYNTKSSEVTYVQANTYANLRLRIPPGYPSTALPDVISASGVQKQDLREQIRRIEKELLLGEPALDAIIAGFQELAASVGENDQRRIDSNADHANGGRMRPSSEEPADKKLTTIIWLHHLLATSKRKQVLAPTLPGVSGVSKPGYPGILIFSGPAGSVRQHVQELKQLKWQAFQVRYEEEEEWKLNHGTGVIEVETMGEVVKEIGQERKEEFMSVMRMK